MIEIRPIQKSDLGIIIEERNKVMETLRTPFMLNLDMQIDYYNKIICNRDSKTRYFIFEENGQSIGYGGLENIEWENSRAEISLLVWKSKRRKRYGTVCAEIILKYGFESLNFHSVYGECYYSGMKDFWKSFLIKCGRNFFTANLKDTKYYLGKYYDSFYFTIIKDGD